MIKHWAKLSCLFACSQILVIACSTEDEDDAPGPTSTTTGTTNTDGSAGDSSGGSAGEPSTTSGTTNGTTSVGSGGSSAGAGGMAGGGGEGGAPEPEHVSDLVGLEDGEFHDGAAPDSGGYDGTQISDIVGPESVTNGGTFTIKVTVPGATGDMTFVVAVEGDSGHFTTTVTGVDGVFDIPISLNADVELETFSVSVAPTDAEGDVGKYKSVDLDLIESGTGEVKVTLTFDTSTDLDLVVVEPDGTEIFFNEPVSPNGGTLDLDSNSNCTVIDGTNIENIFYPPDSTPLEGEYLVFVDYYAACEGAAETVNYTVTITNGDTVTTVTGAYDAAVAGTEDGSRLVATFTVD